MQGPVLNRGPLGMLSVYRDCELATIELTLGRPQRAMTFLEPYHATPFALSVAVTTAQVCLALDDRGRAKDCVRSVLTDPSPQVDRSVLVSALLCEAQIAAVEGDEPRAVDYLGRAIHLADGEIVMPFVGASGFFRPLLLRHPTTAAGWPHGLDIPQGIESARGHRGLLAEPLTERENAVLRLLTTTMSVTQIADELYLSVNTVKTHLAAIYRKIGVGKRREAVAQARELELL